MQPREIIMLVTLAIILLTPISALVSQLWGHHKRLKSSRVWFTLINFVICPALFVLLFFSFSELRATELVALLLAAIIYNIFAIWIQREKPLQNNIRKWVNLAFVVGGLIWVSCISYNQYKDYDAPTIVEETDGWTDELVGYDSQEEKKYLYRPEDFERDFGFTIPVFDVVSKKSWRENGSTGQVIEIKTHEAVTKDFLRKQALKNENECAFKDGVYYYSFIDPMYGNLQNYKIIHNDNHSLTITIEHP